MKSEITIPYRFLQHSDEKCSNCWHTLLIVSLVAMISCHPLILPAQSQKPMSLQQCLDDALASNLRIKAAGEQVGAAHDLRKAAFSQFLPNFSINGSYSYLGKDFQLLDEDKYLPVIPYTALGANGKFNPAALKDPAIAPTVIAFNPATGQPLTDASGNPVFRQYAWLPASQSRFSIGSLYVVNAGMVQPLFMGGKILETYRISRSTEKLATGKKALETSEVLLETEKYYWTVVSLREKVRVAKKYRALLENIQANVDSYYQNGLATKNDLLKVNVKMNEAELSIIQAENGQRLATMALCEITGHSLAEKLEPIDSLCGIQPEISTDSLLALAMENRPELAILDQSIAITHSAYKLAQSRYLPNIALTASSVWMNPNPWSGFSREFGNDLNVGLVCNIPLFHWGEKNQVLDAARHEENVARIKREEAGEKIALELQQTLFKLKESEVKCSLISAILNQARENLEFSENCFAAGTQKLSDILEAQTQYEKSLSDQLDAFTEFRLILTSLKKITGQLK